MTSKADILDGVGEGLTGGGVPPSSDLTSCIVNGTAARSSEIPSSELTLGFRSDVDGCDHTALRCSGSGARAAISFAERETV